MVWYRQRKSQEARTGLGQLFSTWSIVLHVKGNACSQNSFYRLNLELTGSDSSCYLIRYFESNSNKCIFLTLKLKNKLNFFKCSLYFIRKDKAVSFSCMETIHMTSFVLKCHCEDLLCFFKMFTIRVAASTGRIIVHFIELTHRTKENKKGHWITTQFPLGPLPQSTLTDLLGFS